MIDLHEDSIQEVLPVREQVANIVRRRIMKQEIKSGERISERAISKMLQVSTTPVKEAFRMLVTEGLLITVQRKGTFVSEYSQQNLIQITYIRGALEGVAAFFAAQQINMDEIIEMDQALSLSAGYILAKDPVRLSSSNAQFHDIIRKVCRNQYLINMLKTLRSVDDSVRSISLWKDDEERIRAHAEHCAIAKAIRGRDSEQAEALMVQHIRRVIEHTLEESLYKDNNNNPEGGNI